jgi:general secretion pathway protein I
MCENRAEYKNRSTPPLIKGGVGGFGARSPHGFTLLEVIIALAILGVAFALAMELLAAGVRSAKASEDYTQAVLLARQKMAEVAVTQNLTGVADTGEFGGGFRWISEVRPLEQQEELPGRLFSVRVRVSWPSRQGEKSVNLQTLRMAVDEKKLGQTRVVQ